MQNKIFSYLIMMREFRVFLKYTSTCIMTHNIKRVKCKLHNKITIRIYPITNHQSLPCEFQQRTLRQRKIEWSRFSWTSFCEDGLDCQVLGMENKQKRPSLKHEETLQNETFTLEDWPFDFPYKQNVQVKNVYKTKRNFENLKDCIHEPDNNNKIITTSNVDDKNKQNILDRHKDFFPLPDKEITVDNLMETIDLSDLTFSSNDFILDDCTCFEQASQLVDPTIKDLESTPFSFNNSDSVQLFRFSLAESTEDSLSNLAKYSDYVININSEKCKMIFGNDNVKNDHYNVYHVFELLENNVSKDSKNFKEETVQFKSKKSVKKENEKSAIIAPIKKGRRYLPNFKHKVLEYAKNHTFKETAFHFEINCNTITDWSRESKRLSLQSNKTSMPGSDFNNYKTDINGTPESKTEIILLNDVIRFETDFNKSSMKDIENDLPSLDMKPDERFVKWIEMKRLQRKQLTKQEVLFTAKCCFKKCPLNQEKPSWFVLYLERFNKALKNSVNNVETEKYIKYPVNFKLEVALYARIFTKNSAARVFNVPRRRIFDWFSCLNPLKDSFDLHGKNGIGGSSVISTENDKFIFNIKKDKAKSKIYLELHLWYQKMFSSGARPTSFEIKEKARELFSSHGITNIKFSDGWLQKFCQRMNIKLRHSEDDRLLLWVLTQLDNNISLSHQEITEKSSSLIGNKKFKGSKGWTLRFLKRHRNLLQRPPKVQDQLPRIVQDKLNYFWNNFRNSLISFQIQPGNIGCMDEIPLSFSYPEDGSSKSLPLLRKTGFENCQGVVLLCALACGRILPPAVVFKGTGPKQLLSDRNIEILILYQEKGFVSIDILEAWFNDIWLSCVPTPNALVIDSFEPHCAEKFRQLSVREKCLLHVIPEGCSSRFQPLDVEATPLFKEAIKKQWKEFSSSLNSKLMRRYRCPDQDTILRWVQSAYDKIKRNPLSIINSFKITGLLQTVKD